MRINNEALVNITHFRSLCISGTAVSGVDTVIFNKKGLKSFIDFPWIDVLGDGSNNNNHAMKLVDSIGMYRISIVLLGCH